MSAPNFYNWLHAHRYGTAAMDASHDWKEEQHPRESAGGENGGRFRVKPETLQLQDVLDPTARKEDEGVRSYTTRAVKKGDRWVELREDEKGKSLRNDHDSFGKKGKHEKWLRLPPPEDKNNPTPTLDSFSNVPNEDSGTISGIPESHLYIRKAKRENPGENGPQYEWEKGGEPLSESECLRLEKALAEGGYTGALFDGNSDVKVRPDLKNDSGQIATWSNGRGKLGSAYGRAAIESGAVAKAKRVGVLYGVYDKIKQRIAQGVMQNDPYAWLAYFMLRTKVRVGSSSDPQDGRGATDLVRGDVSFSDDGETFYLAFNSKGRQFWHSTVKDKPLYEYLKQRKSEIAGDGANKKPLFDVSLGKYRDYLKSISADLTGDPEIFMKPHDFRRLGATRVADEYLRQELAGMDVVKDRKKWEDRICKAVQKAAQHLNDTPKVAFGAYILPVILFATSHDDLVKYFPHLKNV